MFLTNNRLLVSRKNKISKDYKQSIGTIRSANSLLEAASKLTIKKPIKACEGLPRTPRRRKKREKKTSLTNLLKTALTTLKKINTPSTSVGPQRKRKKKDPKNPEKATRMKKGPNPAPVKIKNFKTFAVDPETQDLAKIRLKQMPARPAEDLSFSQSTPMIGQSMTPEERRRHRISDISIHGEGDEQSFFEMRFGELDQSGIGGPGFPSKELFVESEMNSFLYSNF